MTPAFKGGYGAVFEAASPDGESVEYQSQGVFSGTPETASLGTDYLAVRASSGWKTTPEQPPFRESEIVDFSPNLLYALGVRSVGDEKNEAEFLLHDLDEPDIPSAWEPFNEILVRTLVSGHLTAAVGGDSGDFCHVELIGNNLLPEGIGPNSEVYDYARGCRGEGPWLRLVGVRNRLGPNMEPEPFRKEDPCPVYLGTVERSVAEGSEQQAELFAVSADGSEIFFTADTKGEAKCDAPQVYVRLGGAETLEVSRPLNPQLPFGGCSEGGLPGEVAGEVPCAGAGARRPSFFKGASEDGSRVFFTSQEQLIEDDADGSEKLFMATIECPADGTLCTPPQRRVTSLTDISRAADASEPARVRGVVNISRDGSHVYFVASGALTINSNEEGDKAVRGADNLYVYDAETGSLTFIADLCSDANKSGEIGTSRCPASLTAGANDTKLWGIGTGTEAESTPDGRFVVFSTFARLNEHGLQTDGDNARDIYRYDSQTNILDRVSLGEEGYDANGNKDGFDATITPVSTGKLNLEKYGLRSRVISADGSQIVFQSAEPLSPSAINNRNNIYIWKQMPGDLGGSVSMVSSGSSLTEDIAPTISVDGRNILFTTTAGLVPADTEGDIDVYDARIEGGFGESAVEPVQCSSDACQGALSIPSPILIPGSISQAPGENLSDSPQMPTSRKTKTPMPKHRHTRKRAGKARFRSGRGSVVRNGPRPVRGGRWG